MPVKISTSTNPATGEITNADRNKMINDFVADVGLEPLNGRPPIVKKYQWYITREEMESLFILNRNANGEHPILLQINFSVNLNGVAEICGHPISDSLTVVLQGTNRFKTPVNPEEEYVIIPGFNNFNTPDFDVPESVLGTGCCPSSNP